MNNNNKKIDELIEKIENMEAKFLEVEKLIAEIKASQLSTKQIGSQVLKAIEDHNKKYGEKQ